MGRNKSPGCSSSRGFQHLGNFIYVHHIIMNNSLIVFFFSVCTFHLLLATEMMNNSGRILVDEALCLTLISWLCCKT